MNRSRTAAGRAGEHSRRARRRRDRLAGRAADARRSRRGHRAAARATVQARRVHPRSTWPMATDPPPGRARTRTLARSRAVGYQEALWRRAGRPRDRSGRGTGQFVTILGPSGSGKTTLLNLIAGLIEPSAGQIRIGGRDVTRLPAAQRNVGLVFQSYALFPHMTVFGNVAFPLRVRGLPHADIDRRVADVLRLVRLSGLEHSPISSPRAAAAGGARAMVFEPMCCSWTSRRGTGSHGGEVRAASALAAGRRRHDRARDARPGRSPVRLDRRAQRRRGPDRVPARDVPAPQTGSADFLGTANLFERVARDGWRPRLTRRRRTLPVVATAGVEGRRAWAAPARRIVCATSRMGTECRLPSRKRLPRSRSVISSVGGRDHRGRCRRGFGPIARCGRPGGRGTSGGSRTRSGAGRFRTPARGRLRARWPTPLEGGMWRCAWHVGYCLSERPS